MNIPPKTGDQDSVDALSSVVGLPIAPDHAPGVRQNFTLIADMARLIAEFPLDDCRDEAAPVFTSR